MSYRIRRIEIEQMGHGMLQSHAFGEMDVGAADRVKGDFSVRLTKSEQEQLDVLTKSIADRVKATLADGSPS
jgi:hypothetical protein